MSLPQYLNRLTALLCANCVKRTTTTIFQVLHRQESTNPPKVGLTKNAPKFQVFCVSSDGVRSAYDVSKSVLYQELGLTVRDMRFQHTNMLTVRNRKIILRFKKLKAIVCSDAVLLIDPPYLSTKTNISNSEGIAEFWNKLPSQLTGSSLYTSNLPLEYRAVEVIFMHIISNFKLSLQETEPDITGLLNVLTDPKTLVVDRSLVHVLLQKSARLNTFSTSVREFCDLLEEILEYDDDIRNLCISIDVGEGGRSMYDAFIFNPYESGPTSDNSNSDGINNNNQSGMSLPRRIDPKYKINLQDEMETLIDSFLRDAEEISNKVVELKEAIENSNTAILINLDSHRNLLLRLDLQLTMGMFSCTIFGMLGMAFGMNLDSSWEENPLAFWAVSGVMFGGAGIVWRLLLKSLRNNTLGVPPSTPKQGPDRKGSRTEKIGKESNKTSNRKAQHMDINGNSGLATNSHRTQTKLVYQERTDSFKMDEFFPLDVKHNANVSPHDLSRRINLHMSHRTADPLKMRPIGAAFTSTPGLLSGKSKHRHYR
uniref:Magnesium transporter n=1 Tax=Phallusia mammillata TaxID=59560 RepID=A0A6F9DKQ0_9ASCI|nr:magnesium transporter MRS2 homolog, mitochondrial precursor [Phallusia mammillata]